MGPATFTVRDPSLQKIVDNTFLCWIIVRIKRSHAKSWIVARAALKPAVLNALAAMACEIVIHTMHIHWLISRLLPFLPSMDRIQMAASE